MTEVGRRAESSKLKAESLEQRIDDGGQKSECGRRAESSKLKAESGKHRTEDR